MVMIAPQNGDLLSGGLSTGKNAKQEAEPKGNCKRGGGIAPDGVLHLSRGIYCLVLRAFKLRICNAGNR